MICGRWLICATSRSWSCGEMSCGTAPIALAIACMRSMAPVGRRFVAAKEVWRILEQIGVRRVGAGMFQSGHRVASDEGNVQTFRLAADRDLRAAHIGDQMFLRS